MKPFVITTLLASLLSLNTAAMAAQTCNPAIPLQKPNSIYVDNGNGTVTDKTTGLIWQKCSVGQAYNQSGSGGCTDPSDLATLEFNWQEALAAAKSANQSSLLGFSDWRLPSVAELRTLVEKACYSPAINLTVFPNTADAVYWSASPDAYGNSYAWSVSFSLGYESYLNKINDFHVRLVRGGQ